MASRDLVLVLHALQELHSVTVPAGVDLKTAPQRWADYTMSTEDAGLFAGEILLHTDFAADNVLIDGERARIIDWAWPTRGAAFIDPFVLAVRMMEAGQTADDAITWVSRLPAWREAPAEAVEAFAAPTTHMWGDIAQADPQPWKTNVAQCASAMERFLRTRPRSIRRG
ncbi:hypothetical protein [Streptomyces sp. NPDC017435]|uniref:hypothetical protein n=1 Tax=Streptomyces sp. NPDC017435 TaxID=3364995 RepID=UPI00379E02D6